MGPAAVAVALVVAVLPALLLYAPVLHHGGLHAIDDARYYGGRFGSLVSVGPLSLLWGGFDAWIVKTGRVTEQNGSPPIFLLAAVLSLVAAIGVTVT